MQRKLKLDTFVEKYGTKGASLIIRCLLDTIEDSGDAGGIDKGLIHEIADDLQAALEELKA